MTKVTILAGGVGGAKFAKGVRSLTQGKRLDVTVIANTGDDLWLTGLRVCPDLDSIMYALAGANDTERGWGRAGESERVSAELAAYGVGWPWFTLGDLDLGTHIARTSLLREGLSLTQVTERLTSRWDLGVKLLPATDDEVDTHVEVMDPDGGLRTIHFEEWWVRHRAQLPATRFLQQGIAEARISQSSARAISEADVILVAPSNPVVSIGTMLAVPGFREALATADAPVVGVSPIIAGSPVRGMADACLSAIGVAATASGVAGFYRSRSSGGILDGWLVDLADSDAAPELRSEGIACEAVPLWMTDDAATAKMAETALGLAAGSGRRSLGGEHPRVNRR